MTEVPTQQPEETPIDEELFDSICAQAGRGIRARVLNILDSPMGGYYSKSDEGLRRVLENSSEKLERNNGRGVRRLGKTSLTAIQRYLKEKGLL